MSVILFDLSCDMSVSPKKKSIKGIYKLKVLTVDGGGRIRKVFECYEDHFDCFMVDNEF